MQCDSPDGICNDLEITRREVEKGFEILPNQILKNSKTSVSSKV